MKINIITCHFVHNYGAVLQAYALSKKLEQLFPNTIVEIIDYRPEYLAVHHKVLHVGAEKYRHNALLKIMYIVRTFPFRYKTYKNFDNFVHNRLSITDKQYISFEQLKENPPIADVYICGSDQIWNYRVDNGKDPSFYLEFVKKGYKVAYAPSFAVSDILEEEANIIKPWIENINLLSVRELAGLGILSKMGFHNVPVVLDPVYLLDKSDWIGLTHEIKRRKKYILIYKITRNKALYTLAHVLAKQVDADVIEIGFSAKCDGKVDRYLCGVKIEDFLSFINGAEIIVTDSFHGMSFSIIFEKKFVVFDRGSVNSRIESMLNLTQLNEQFYSSEKNADFYINHPIDYTRVNALLKEEQIKSVNYLKKIGSGLG